MGTCIGKTLSCYTDKIGGSVLSRNFSAAFPKLVSEFHALHSTAILLKAAVIHNLHRGPTLDCQTWVAKGAGITGLHNNLKDTSRQATNPRTTNSQLKHNPSLPVKKAYLLSLQLQAKRQTSGVPNTQKLRRCSQETKVGRYHPCTSP